MKKSNLYIERIYKDHPIACWPLDDEISYMQRFSPEQQDLTSWNVTNATIRLANFFRPIKTSTANIATLSGTFNFVATIESSFDIPTSSFAPGVPAEFSMYINNESYLVYKYEIGVSIDGDEQFSTYEFGYDYGWKHISHTFDVTGSLVSFFIRIYVYASGPVDVQLSAASLGQNSEPYSPITMGYYVDPLEFPHVITGPYTHMVALDAYSIDPDNNGIYFGDDIAGIGSVPGGIPMTFGSYQTALNIGDLCFGVPANGFLSEAGKNSSYTLEFWLRSEPSMYGLSQIVSTFETFDGLYGGGGFLTLIIGGNTKSYFVGQWQRPMLIHIQYSPKRASLMINGEVVIKMDIDSSKITDTINWLGFYGYSNVLEIDSVALYPYLLPPQIAKKHFVYGQGVQEADFSNSRFLKKTIQIDYPVAGYSYNVIYPDTIKWRSGFSVGLDTTTTSLAAKTPTLPVITASSDWMNAMFGDVYDGYYFRLVYDDERASIMFKNMNFIGERINSVFGVFESSATPGVLETLFLFTNTRTSEKFRIALSDGSLRYTYISPLGIETELDSMPVSDSTEFVAGINLLLIAAEYYGVVGNMFSSQDSIRVNIGCDDGDNYFSGKIFSINFDNQYFYNKNLSAVFTSSLYDPSTPDLHTYNGTYTLRARLSPNFAYFDVATTGYWEDVIPLSMFDRKISAPTPAYAIDFIQLNIDSSIPQTLGPSDGDTDVKVYITIQPSQSAGTINYNDFITIVDLPENRVHDIVMSTIGTTKYRVYDGAIIMIPQDIDYNDYFLGVHIEVESSEAIRKPVYMRRLELASYAQNDGVDTPMGTKFYSNIYPFAESI